MMMKKKKKRETTNEEEENEITMISRGTGSELLVEN